MSELMKGRLDVFLARLVEEGSKRAQAATGFDFWNGLPEHGQSGLKQITEDLIDQAGIPRVAVDLPRTLAAGLAEFIEGGSARAKPGEATRLRKRPPSHRVNQPRRARRV